MGRWNPFTRSGAGRGAGDRPPPEVAAAAGEQLYESGRYEPALAAFLDAAEGWARVRAQRPADLEPKVHMAAMLLNAGECFGKLRRFEEAVAVLVTAEDLMSELVAEDEATWGPSLAAVLEKLAGAFAETGRLPEALAVSRRAVELREAAGAEHDLAVALRVFAHMRAAAGTELREAFAAVVRAMDLQLAFAARLPDPTRYKDQIYLTQQVQALVVSRM